MALDRNQVDAITQAIMQPDLDHQNSLREKRAAADRDLATRRSFAKYGLAGFAIGGTIGHLASLLIGMSFLIGGASGVLLGRIYQWVVAKRRAA